MQETLAIMTILETAYPRFYANKSVKEKQEALELWATLFANDSAEIVTEAVKAMICTLEYPPYIADIKKKIALLSRLPAPTELEAWATVKKAISYYDAEENFKMLPEILKKLVGSPAQLREWALLETKHLETVVQSNFMRSYTARVQQIKEYSMLPESSKQLISGLSQTMLGKGGDSDAEA
ncbi:MAG TPA: replicative helicase loader/inhibitor [Ruminiclostridium sp.]|nr:replicative helicase loader/inhibitor [Ruminiclostridium sp.]